MPVEHPREELGGGWLVRGLGPRRGPGLEAETEGGEYNPGSCGCGWSRLSGTMCGARGNESPRHLTSKGWAEAEGPAGAQRQFGQDGGWDQPGLAGE